MARLCGIFWGSHGCMLPENHEGLHCCDCCPGGAEHVAAHQSASEDSYGAEGCAATWPYYGRPHMNADGGLQFFRLSPTDFVKLPTEFDRMAAIKENE